MYRQFLRVIVLCVTLIVYVTCHADPVAHPPHIVKPHVNNTLPSGLTPAIVSKAYGFDKIIAQGAGQIIAIVDAYNDPNIEADLAVFDKMFSLPACTTANGCFTKVYATGKKPATDSGWALEIALDVEWAHAIAPKAKIILVEAADASMNALIAAINVAIGKKAHTISMSWGADEFSDESAFDSTFNVSGVTFLASSGDNGTGVIYPAASPYVVAVGGTTLSVDDENNYVGETAWSGSGGGISAYESEPTYQATLPIPNDSMAMRGVPDVAYNADPSSGFSVYTSVMDGGQKGWLVVGGTSAGAPQWAALMAIANSTLKYNLSNTTTVLYNAAAHNCDYNFNYHDITSGSNGVCSNCTAAAGYDYVTGLGAPRANRLIANIGNY